MKRHLYPPILALAAALTLFATSVSWLTLAIGSIFDSSDRFTVASSTRAEYLQSDGSSSQLVWKRRCLGMTWKVNINHFVIEMKCAGLPLGTASCSPRNRMESSVPCPPDL